MIQKFKDILQISKNLEQVDTKLKTLSSDSEELRVNFDSVKKSVEELKKTVVDSSKVQEKLLKNFNENVDAISSIRDEMKEELFKFSVLKGQMQDKIMKKFSEELENEIAERKKDLDVDTGKYKEVKGIVEETALELGKAKQEIKKWIDISSKIKAEDFELIKFTKQMKELESEKLELMQKVDNLERMIGKMRRNQR